MYCRERSDAFVTAGTWAVYLLCVCVEGERRGRGTPAPMRGCACPWIRAHPTGIIELFQPLAETS